MTRVSAPLELADVVADVVGDEGEHLVGDALEVVGVGLHAQDREAGLEVGRLDVGDEPPLEAGPEALVDVFEELRRTVGRDHDLVTGVVEVVEGVEELLLELLGVLEELDVVHEQHVDLAVAPPGSGNVAYRVASTNSFMNVSVVM